MTDPVLHVIDKQPKTVALTSQKRVNHTTLEDHTPSEVLDSVKDKLAKDLFNQLMNSSLIRINSKTNPKNGSVTFYAVLECVDGSTESDATKA